MSNVDIELELDIETINELLNIYIKHNMSNASYEVFLREKSVGDAVLNEAILNAIELGIINEKTFKKK